MSISLARHHRVSSIDPPGRLGRSRSARAARVSSTLFLLFAVFSLAAQSALANGCKGSPRKTDNFVDIDASWRADPGRPSVEENRLKVKASEDGKTLIYKGIRLDQGEICVTLRSPNIYSDASATEAGIVFRAVRIPATDDYSYCFLALSPDGSVRLRNCRVEPSWVLSKDWPNVSGIHTGRGASNDLRVTLRRGALGTVVTFWINETKLDLGSIPFPPLLGGGELGLRAVSEEGATNTWKFSDFAVTELP